MRPRGKWQGMLTIVRFNWPLYLAALGILIAAVYGFFWIHASVTKWTFGAIVVGALYFLIGSLSVSHWVYDRSDLYRWAWLSRALGGTNPTRIIFCHSGFDETSRDLEKHLSDVEWVVLDHYEETRMTEASIRRARKLFPPTALTRKAPYDCWPVAAETVDVVLGLLAIHELRSEDERIAWFTEAKRCIKPGGRVLLAEHSRDLANFLAFGPGFLHFHSCASWQRCWQNGGFHAIDEFRVTPWIRIFILST
jgi:Methyltransferase domain